MKLKYCIVLILLISVTPEIWAQKGLTFYSGLTKSDYVSNHSSGNILKIKVKRPDLYAGMSHSISLDFEFENNGYDDIYFKGNMPTLNQLKNTMIGNIEVSAVSAAIINFDNSKDGEQEDKNEEKSFFSSNLFYFLGAAVLATTFYIIWQDNQNESSTKTFGYPPRPQTDP